MSAVDDQNQDSTGVPAWVMTFADLMTLLMCFFVLLLAFSEMDVARFKMLSGSMREAFGVQAEIEARTIPKGTSVIAREFSPGKPDPTLINSIRQHTVDTNKNSLDALFEEPKEIERARRHALRIREALKDEIERGDVAVALDGTKVIIRVLEKASFDSGSADVRTRFKPVLSKIASLLDENSGSIAVSGHTDNVPIRTSRFRSNWELSTSRAVSVAHELLRVASVDENRFVVIGHADTKPRAPNDSPESRSRNRRVDISIQYGILEDIVKNLSVGLDQPPSETGANNAE